MSFPNIPNITPIISLTIKEVVNLLLSSIALEEMGLAHIINAEAEKLQFVLGTLPGQTQSISIDEDKLLEVNKSVEQLLGVVMKNQMLLQSKLEDVLSIPTSSTTTSTTTTTTTTTKEHHCAPGFKYAVFSRNNLIVAAQTEINADTQVNGNLTVVNSGNEFLGNTNVVNTFTDSHGGNIYQNLVLHAPPVPFKSFDVNCLKTSADQIINGDVKISSTADASKFQNSTVWVNGSVNITGNNISITGGGIMASGSITISGSNFAYTSTKCIALLSQSCGIKIINGPYRITGIVYTSLSSGDIRLAACQGGSVCGAIISGRDIIIKEGNGVHKITNTGMCNRCISCSDYCPS